MTSQSRSAPLTLRAIFCVVVDALKFVAAIFSAVPLCGAAFGPAARVDPALLGGNRFAWLAGEVVGWRAWAFSRGAVDAEGGRCEVLGASDKFCAVALWTVAGDGAAVRRAEALGSRDGFALPARAASHAGGVGSGDGERGADPGGRVVSRAAVEATRFSFPGDCRAGGGSLGRAADSRRDADSVRVTCWAVVCPLSAR